MSDQLLNFFYFSDIRCVNTETTKSFTAFLTLPFNFEAVPVFEDKPKIDATTHDSCRLVPTTVAGITDAVGKYQLFVSDFDACGVRKCRHSQRQVTFF